LLAPGSEVHVAALSEYVRPKSSLITVSCRSAYT